MISFWTFLNLLRSTASDRGARLHLLAPWTIQLPSLRVLNGWWANGRTAREPFHCTHPSTWDKYRFSSIRCDPIRNQIQPTATVTFWKQQAANCFKKEFDVLQVACLVTFSWSYFSHIHIDLHVRHTLQILIDETRDRKKTTNGQLKLVSMGILKSLIFGPNPTRRWLPSRCFQNSVSSCPTPDPVMAYLWPCATHVPVTLNHTILLFNLSL